MFVALANTYEGQVQVTDTHAEIASRALHEITRLKPSHRNRGVEVYIFEVVGEVVTPQYSVSGDNGDTLRVYTDTQPGWGAMTRLLGNHKGRLAGYLTSQKQAQAQAESEATIG